jgi:hypothetical protein
VFARALRFLQILAAALGAVIGFALLKIVVALISIWQSKSIHNSHLSHLPCPRPGHAK